MDYAAWGRGAPTVGGMEQGFQLFGAVLILIGFVGAQQRWMSPQSRSYLVLNFVGSLALAGTALAGRDWGFVLLETVWAAVSGWALVRGPAPDTAG